MTIKFKKGVIIKIKDNSYIENMKVLITSDPVLVYEVFDKWLFFTTDASNIGIGAKNNLNMVQ